MNDDWVPIQKDDVHVKREREKARKLKKSRWWTDKLALGVCHHCGKRFKQKELTLDHLVPLSRGGKTTKGNCVVSCIGCNQEKKSLTKAEMILNQLKKEKET